MQALVASEVVKFFHDPGRDGCLCCGFPALRWLCESCDCAECMDVLAFTGHGPLLPMGCERPRCRIRKVVKPSPAWLQLQPAAVNAERPLVTHLAGPAAFCGPALDLPVPQTSGPAIHEVTSTAAITATEDSVQPLVPGMTGPAMLPQAPISLDRDKLFDLDVGVMVMLHSLTRCPARNGQEGAVVCKENDRGRVAVRLRGHDEAVRVLPAHCRPLEAGRRHLAGVSIQEHDAASYGAATPPCGHVSPDAAPGFHVQGRVVAVVPATVPSCSAATGSSSTLPTWGFGSVPSTFRHFDASSAALSEVGAEFTDDDGMVEDEAFDPALCVLCDGVSQTGDGLCAECHAAREHGDW